MSNMCSSKKTGKLRAEKKEREKGALPKFPRFYVYRNSINNYIFKFNAACFNLTIEAEVSFFFLRKILCDSINKL